MEYESVMKITIGRIQSRDTCGTIRVSDAPLSSTESSHAASSLSSRAKRRASAIGSEAKQPSRRSVQMPTEERYGRTTEACWRSPCCVRSARRSLARSSSRVPASALFESSRSLTLDLIDLTSTRTDALMSTEAVQSGRATEAEGRAFVNEGASSNWSGSTVDMEASEMMRETLSAETGEGTLKFSGRAGAPSLVRKAARPQLGCIPAEAIPRELRR
mmetsp:Transcript_33790/g.77199  ORF Transcript_33790/g.77199 Transcript_33790/m.77199 type:complete len:217 (-) Transcript_33790:477-1127(-)